MAYQTNPIVLEVAFSDVWFEWNRSSEVHPSGWQWHWNEAEGAAPDVHRTPVHHSYEGVQKCFPGGVALQEQLDS